MTLARKYWSYCALFIGVQLIIIYSIIYRENNYIANLYKLQKLEHIKAQLTSEYSALQNELQKSKDLGDLKTYAEKTLHLQQLPLTSFRSLYDNDTL